jgi:hypothetical protein
MKETILKPKLIKVAIILLYIQLILGLFSWLLWLIPNYKSLKQENYPIITFSMAMMFGLIFSVYMINKIRMGFNWTRHTYMVLYSYAIISSLYDYITNLKTKITIIDERQLKLPTNDN